MVVIIEYHYSRYSRWEKQCICAVTTLLSLPQNRIIGRIYHGTCKIINSWMLWIAEDHNESSAYHLVTRGIVDQLHLLS